MGNENEKFILENCMYYSDKIASENDYENRKQLINEAIDYLNNKSVRNTFDFYEDYYDYFAYLKMLILIHEKEINLTVEDREKIKKYIGKLKYKKIMSMISDENIIKNNKISLLKRELSILADAILLLESGEIKTLKENIYNFIKEKNENEMKMITFEDLNENFGFGNYAFMFENNNVAGLELREDVIISLIELLNDKKLVFITTSIDNYINNTNKIYDFPCNENFKIQSNEFFVDLVNNMDIDKMTWTPTFIGSYDYVKNKRLEIEEI